MEQFRKNWLYFFTTAVLIVVIAAASLFSTVNYRFWILGMLSALFVRRKNIEARFFSYYTMIFVLIFVGLGLSAFLSLMFLFIGEAILLLWSLDESDWANKELPNTRVLIPISLLGLIFLAFYVRGYDAALFRTFILLFCLCRPFFWSAQKGTAQSDNQKKVEFLLCVVSIGTIFHIFTFELNVIDSLAMSLCALFLAAAGHRTALPLFFLLSLSFFYREFLDFAGAVCFLIYFGGWALRLGSVLLIIGISLVTGFEADWRYWCVATISSFILSLLWNEEPATAKSLKTDWTGIFGLLALVALPSYFHLEWLVKQTQSATVLSLIPIAAFVLFAVGLFFWRPRPILFRFNYEKLWEKLCLFLRKGENREGILLEPPLSQYQFAFASSARRLIDNENYEIFVWMIQNKLSGDYMLDRHKKSLKTAEKYFSKFEKVMSSKTNLAFPWPSWVEPWSKAISQKQETSVIT